MSATHGTISSLSSANAANAASVRATATTRNPRSTSRRVMTDPYCLPGRPDDDRGLTHHRMWGWLWSP